MIFFIIIIIINLVKLYFQQSNDKVDIHIY